eukprot:CAMPEP_0182945210 /NCGR_PEP_ID=MMETSP0105_2-20130417/55195_1 /TAXON_ID=81532 ORGANISM="Acanthoeca-like sp., Strain 10tr" /NCGR_SAMPLE_ID=MMETSP0105_2 /ASSEMBLY_ACC=CAM_ASM_000205 /LENGTH=53 /DNA_ID=CAMNT_0025085213 /DNA_START=78 /DNA_END=235 /DNA_ORIENTATION=+
MLLCQATHEIGPTTGRAEGFCRPSEEPADTGDDTVQSQRTNTQPGAWRTTGSS